MSDQLAEQPQTDFEPHELALLLPEMMAEEFEGLKKSIDQNGQLQPVVIFEDKILDGLHRFRACRELGVMPRTTMLPEGANPLEYVLAANLHRRHLTTSQRAMIATELKTRLEKEAEERQKAVLKQGTSPVVANLPQRENIGRSREKAAEAMKVSPRSVQDAGRVRQQSPELGERVKKGEVTLNAARQQLAEKAEPAAEVNSEPVHEGPTIIVWNKPESVPKQLLAQHPNRIVVAVLGNMPTAHVRPWAEQRFPGALKISAGMPARKGWQCQ